MAEPELAGGGLALSCAWADTSRLEPSRGGAAWDEADIVRGMEASVLLSCSGIFRILSFYRPDLVCSVKVGHV